MCLSVFVESAVWELVNGTHVNAINMITTTTGTVMCELHTA